MKKFFVILSALLISFNSFSQSLKKQGLIFESRTYNFGDVEQWSNQPAIFTFTNKTKHPVTILPIFNENDLDVTIPEKPIKVGETIIIEARYYTAGKGSFNRKFNIYFGSLAKPVVFTINGNIKSLSPSAYIQCPMSKPEMAKPKIELIGDVAEIDTEIPLSGVSIEIVGLQNNKNITLFSDSKGRFGSKLPVGNYQIIVRQPNYHSYSGSIYLGQTSPPLRLRLTPIIEEAVFAQNKTTNDDTQNKNRKLQSSNNKQNSNDKAQQTNKKSKIPNNRSESSNDEPQITNTKDNKKPKDKTPKKNTGLDRNIDYVKNEPKDSPYSSKNPNPDDIPNTLTTYKESKNDSEPKKENTNNETPVYKQPEVVNEEPLNNKTDDNFTNEISTYEKEKDVIAKEPKHKKENNYKEPKEKEAEEEKVNKEEKSPKEKRPKELKYKEEKPQKPVKIEEPLNNYTFRVLDEKTLDPIDNASVFVYELYDKQKKHKDKTDERGYSEMEIIKNDYRFVASADGYVSSEIRILKDDKSDSYRIMLSPISNLFDEIYEAKKAKQNDTEVLEKLSFGKTSLPYQEEELETVEKTNEPEIAENIEPIIENKIDDSDIENKRKEDSLKLYLKDLELKNAEKEKELSKITEKEKLQVAKEKEDSLNTIIAKLAKENAEKEQNLKRIEQEKLAELKKQRKQEKLDSLSNYIAELQNKNRKLETNLEKINTEKEGLEQRQREKELLEELAEKDKEKENTAILSKTEYAANNIIFLIDISTSMGKNNKIEMLKTSIKNLATVLRDIDRVAIITYNQKTNTVLESISGNSTQEIITALDSLKTGGLTNGVRGITSAYEMLEYYYIPDGNNQIIIATDGLFSKYNNEMTEYELNRLVKKQASKNMKLTVVGFGKNEDGKELMTKLAKSGDGQYIQIKNDWMTRDVLIKEIQLNSKK